MLAKHCSLSLITTGTLLSGICFGQTCNAVEVAKLLSSDGADGDEFGYSASISGNTIVIGARKSGKANSGSAYVFIGANGVWTQQAKLLADDGSANDYFGYSVSIDGDTTVIGAAFDMDNGTGSGSAYVFTRNESVWTQQAKLLPADGMEGDAFGFSISVSGDTAIVGAYSDENSGIETGSAYVFTRNKGVWIQQAKLLPIDQREQDNFGWSVSIDGNTAVVGATRAGSKFSGAVYVFTRTASVWTQQAKLLPTDGSPNDRFGQAVSINGNTIVIGAALDDDQGSTSGSAYIFSYAGEAWFQQTKLLPADGEAGDQFGIAVSIKGNSAIIAAYQDEDNGPSSGSAYLFDRNGSIWSESAKILPLDGTASDYFGNSVSISANTAVIGASRTHNNMGFTSGSAYAFDLGCSDCPADFTGDGVLDIFDVFAFLDAFGAVDAMADLTGNGVVDIFDVFAFLESYNAGCP